MEKMLSKSKSRFFGKKKSSKNLGISSSDSLATDPERMMNEGVSVPSNRPTPPPSTPADSGTSDRMLNGHPSRLNNHAGSSSMGSGRPMGFHDHENSTTSFSRPSHHGSVSQSRFQVHISPTAFSPIMIPSSSTPPESAAGSPSKHRDISTLGTKYNVERTPRLGEGATHGRSQSSVSPTETPTSRSRSRRHAIPANFLESVGAASGDIKNIWNGQSLGADQYMNSRNTKEMTPSSFPSQTALVHPSASAPVTSWLSNNDTGFISAELAPIHESGTEPAMFSATSSSSSHAPLPRSVPSHNLAGLTPSSSGMTDHRHTAEVSQRPAPRSHRSALSQPISGVPHHRGSTQPLSSSSPTRASDATITRNQSSNNNRTNPAVGSEMEIGYKGLAFPLPPSSEEGLAMSYSSSHSSVYSTLSAQRSGEQLSTLKNTRDGKFRGEHEHEARPPGNAESRATISVPERSARDRNASISMTESRGSPIPKARMTKRQVDDATAEFERAPVNGQNNGGARDIRRQDRVEKQSEEVLGIRPQQDELRNDSHTPIRVRAVSEAPRPHPTGARPQIQPEPTKPLVLNSSRKTIHTTRSFTNLAERKQFQAPSSNRDLAGALNNANGKEERVRAATAIPVRSGPGAQRDREVEASVGVEQIHTQRSDDQSFTPPSFPLPTPPNSSSALSLTFSETKGAEDVPSLSQVGVGMPPVPSLTLEEVTEALRAQRIRFSELSSQVLDVTQRHTAEKDAYVGRVERLESTVAKLEREIRGLRWLVLENTKARGGSVSDAALILDAAGTTENERSEGKNRGQQQNMDDNVASHRTLRRSSTLPHMPTVVQRSGHARNKRFGGLGLDFSPESVGSSPITLSSLATPSRFEVDIGDEEHTPSMDEIIDKLMAVRQWAASDVRVSVVESTGGAGESKRIVFRQV